MTKSTLKNTTQGYVLIVDERPFEGEIGFNIIENRIIPIDENDGNWWDMWRIIAPETPLEGVKGIVFKIKDPLKDPLTTYQKGDIIKRAIDTEVQATEHEEYWVVGL